MQETKESWPNALMQSSISNIAPQICGLHFATWSSLIHLIVALSVFADSTISAFSSLFNGIWIVRMIPFLPRTTGKLKQQPNSGWKWLMGRTFRLSKRIEEQMLETMEPIPKGVAPLAWIMLCDLCLHSFASSAWLKVLGGSDLSMGTPPIVAVDHATTCESPCTPNM